MTILWYSAAKCIYLCLDPYEVNVPQSYFFNFGNPDLKSRKCGKCLCVCLSVITISRVNKFYILYRIRSLKCSLVSLYFQPTGLLICVQKLSLQRLFDLITYSTEKHLNTLETHNNSIQPTRLTEKHLNTFTLVGRCYTIVRTPAQPCFYRTFFYNVDKNLVQAHCNSI